MDLPYPIASLNVLRAYLNKYLPKMMIIADRYGFDFRGGDIVGDHVGIQVMSGDEFDTSDTILRGYMARVLSDRIHNRRNNIYQFHAPLTVAEVTLQGVEIFEPKPTANLSLLRPGIEHIAFTAADYGQVLHDCRDRGVPIAKEAEYSRGAFFKTAVIGGYEIEIRNQSLILQ